MTTVLIVDDSPTEQRVFQKYLQSAGYTTLSAPDADTGMKIARDQNPDLILMDVVMPGTNGFQATRLLSKDPETSAIPIIMVTTKDQETDKVWGKRQGAREYLVKPVKQDVLLDCVTSVLAG